MIVDFEHTYRDSEVFETSMLIPRKSNNIAGEMTDCCATEACSRSAIIKIIHMEGSEMTETESNNW